MMKTEERFANVGEKILVLKDDYEFNFEKGEVLTVEYADTKGYVNCGSGVVAAPNEYEVIVEE